MSARKTRIALIASAAAVAAAMIVPPLASQPAQAEEPIAYIGHGAFFDSKGNELTPTPEFIARAQEWYRQRLAEKLPAEQKRSLADLEKRLTAGVALKGLDALVARQQTLNWMIARIPRDKSLERVPGKIRLLDRRLSELTRDRLSPVLSERIKALDLKPKPGGMVFLTTTKKGQDYINECKMGGVPIPPPINQMAPTVPGWTSRGFIPRTQQFIVGSPAQVRTYSDADGTCIALPRYLDTDGNPNTDETATVDLDGVICLSKTTSKVCFWDNQMNGNGFQFPAGTKIPIGLADTTIDPQGRYQAGGAEIEFGSGGVCTDCHAGENPYIIHPSASLGGGVDFGDVSVFAPQRYIPIVGGSWPQNLLSHSLATVPADCKSCHVQGGAGRLPHLYKEETPNINEGLEGFCNTVLRQAVGNNAAQAGTPAAPATMPQFAEGTLTSTNAASPKNDPTYPLVIFRAFCGEKLSAGPSDRGDPHLITTDGTKYDFQAAGEFTALRNSSNGFELQTRQTPVTTTFTPGTNPHTGLASCVSLNTAVAARLGKRRVSYQSPYQSGAVAGPPPGMVLRIDGRPVTLPAAGLNLGGGNRIDRLTTGAGIRLIGADGSKVIVTPNYWSSQGYWYLDVEVLNTPAREGTMGTILPSNWLPLAPDGQSFGGAPGSLLDRHVLLNQKFAGEWRVKPDRSLFDYAPGTSTATYTDANWPSPPGGSCMTTSVGQPAPRPPLKPRINPEVAARLCQRVTDPQARKECAFDVAVMGDSGVLLAYARSIMARNAN